MNNHPGQEIHVYFKCLVFYIANNRRSRNGSWSLNSTCAQRPHQDFLFLWSKHICRILNLREKCEQLLLNHVTFRLPIIKSSFYFYYSTVNSVCWGVSQVTLHSLLFDAIISQAELTAYMQFPNSPELETTANFAINNITAVNQQAVPILFDNLIFTIIINSAILMYVNHPAGSSVNSATHD